MPSYRCRSHDRSDCRDAVCRRQAERAGLIAPAAPRAARGPGSSASGGRSGPDSATAEARRRARAGELWLGPATVSYSSSGQTSGSVAHLPGGICKVRGDNPDTTGLFEGWARIEGTPNAIDELIRGNFVMATDGSGLIATGLCQSCRRVLG